MFCQVLAGEVVAGGNDALGVDEVADAPGQTEFVVVLARGPFGVVRLPDGVFGVGDQPEGEALGVGEGLLFFDGVEGGTDDGAVGGIEVWGSVTEPSTLLRSTGG